MTRGRIVAAAVAFAGLVVAAGCGIQPDASPRDLPEDEQLLPIDIGQSGAAAAGGDRIYLVGPGADRLLRSVTRNAEQPDDLIEILMLGPNDEELADQYSTNIPPATRVRSASRQGQFLTVDLTDEITELSPQSLVQAIAQIVYTATEIEGVETVRVRVGDETRTWPTVTGEPKTDLRIYDYPGLVQTAQPAYPAVPATPES